MPKVSILLTSFNHEKYLSESIESILNQTFEDFELIILDDASIDNSWQIINNYTDPRIRAFRNEVNRFGDFPNVFRHEANGEYVAIHHSDDAWEPTKLEKQVAFLDSNPDNAAVFTHVQVIDEDGLPFTEENHFYYDVFNQPNRTRYEWLNYFFFKGNALCHPSILIRKSCFDLIMYRQGLAQIPDLDLWVQLCMKFDIHIIQEKLTRFRVRASEANVSGNTPTNRIRSQFELLKLLDHYQSISTPEELLMIFPEANQYINSKNADVLYAIGRVAAEEGNINPTKLFGLNLLFDAVNAPLRAEALQRYQLFDQKAFMELTAEHDIFSTEEMRNLYIKINEREQSIQQLITDLAERDETIQQLKNEVESRDRVIQARNEEIQARDQEIQVRNEEIQARDQEIQAREQEILFYALSKSWRITRPLRKLLKKIKGNKNV